MATKIDMKALLAKVQQRKLELSTMPPHQVVQTTPVATNITVAREVTNTIPTDPLDEVVIPTGIHYNEKQRAFVKLAGEGGSCVLIGAAGTGKTTCMKAVVSQLIQSGLAGTTGNSGHQYIPDNSPGIVVCSFTRRAVANIRKQMPLELRSNCLTIHKLLEFQPTEVDVQTDDGEFKTSKRFMPARNDTNPLPQSIRIIIVEESSMVGGTPFQTDDYLLFNQLVAAIHHKVQFIFLGDIQQLPPVFGPAILGFKMLELPTIELTEVYRQALESPIIRLAHRILSGVPIPLKELPDWQYPDQLTIKPFKRKLDEETAIHTLAAHFKQQYDNGSWNPEEDVILLPFNKGVGTIELNKHLATHIARKEGKLVYEIVAGFENVYLSVGDKVLIGREDAIITKIERNKKYFGKAYSEESTTMDYWGYDSNKHDKVGGTMSDEDIDNMIEAMAGGDDEDYKRQSSHTIYYRKPDSTFEFSISGAGDLNSLVLAYALTIHKAQGSEWRKVNLCLHYSHATMLQRELLYTAVTRAKQELVVICEHDSFIRGIQKQKIPGSNWQEKAVFFKGKIKSAAFLARKATKQLLEEDDE